MRATSHSRMPTARSSLVGSTLIKSQNADRDGHKPGSSRLRCDPLQRNEGCQFLVRPDAVRGGSYMESRMSRWSIPC